MLKMDSDATLHLGYWCMIKLVNQRYDIMLHVGRNGARGGRLLRVSVISEDFQSVISECN